MDGPLGRMAGMGVREDIVAYCRRNIGCDYDYTPSGGVEGESYNCSYLSFCAYRSAGVQIPTWQGHQNGDGSQSDWVRRAGNWTDDPADLEPGDLVFFGSSPYYTTHVGISLGGWDMIDSVPNGGVQERTLYDSFVGGGWPLDDVPDSGGWTLIPAKGTVQFDRRMNIRDYPSTETGNVVDAYEAGDTLNIDGFVLSGGYTWAHYVGRSSGKDRFVALSGDVQFAKAVD